MELKKQLLQFKIEYYREKLIQAGNELGYSDPATIRLSQHLDKLILKYQRYLH